LEFGDSIDIITAGLTLRNREIMVWASFIAGVEKSRKKIDPLL
jgi:hypothetical protein